MEVDEGFIHPVFSRTTQFFSSKNKRTDKKVKNKRTDNNNNRCARIAAAQAPFGSQTGNDQNPGSLSA